MYIKIVIGSSSLSQYLNVAGVNVTFSTSTLLKTFKHNFLKWEMEA